MKGWQLRQQEKDMEAIDDLMGKDPIDEIIEQEDSGGDDWYGGEQAAEYYRLDEISFDDWEGTGW